MTSIRVYKKERKQPTQDIEMIIRLSRKYMEQGTDHIVLTDSDDNYWLAVPMIRTIDHNGRIMEEKVK